VIARGMLEIQNLTCLQFVPRESNQEDYISIISGEGCYSDLGRQGGSQELSLGYGCIYLSTVQHELMHAVGIFHEQSRSDRDDYVKIAFQNIDEENCYNFDKSDFNDIQHLHTLYDLSSVMHYGTYDYSKNKKPTIYVKKNDNLIADENLGQAMRLSQIDAEKLNRLYRCNDIRRRSHQLM